MSKSVERSKVRLSHVNMYYSYSTSSYMYIHHTCCNLLPLSLSLSLSLSLYVSHYFYLCFSPSPSPSIRFSRHQYLLRYFYRFSSILKVGAPSHRYDCLQVICSTYFSCLSSVFFSLSLSLLHSQSLSLSDYVSLLTLSI